MSSKKTLTIKQTAKLLGISEQKVLKMIEDGQIKAIKYGRDFVVPKKEFEVMTGSTLTDSQKKVIDQGVKKITHEYRITLKLLEQEQI